MIALGPGSIWLSIDGKPAKATWTRGDVQFIGRGVPHESKNAGDKPIDFVMVAIKQAIARVSHLSHRARCLPGRDAGRTRRAAYGQWPQFRGPNGSGVEGATGYPVAFSPDTTRQGNRESSDQRSRLVTARRPAGR